MSIKFLPETVGIVHHLMSRPIYASQTLHYYDNDLEDRAANPGIMSYR